MARTDASKTGNDHAKKDESDKVNINKIRRLMQQEARPPLDVDDIAGNVCLDCLKKGIKQLGVIARRNKLLLDVHGSTPDNPLRQILLHDWPLGWPGSGG